VCDNDRCAARVPWDTWRRWPRARVKYITVEHAARLLATTKVGVRLRASRGNWRRIGAGRTRRYHVDDVPGIATDEPRPTVNAGTGGRA